MTRTVIVECFRSENVVFRTSIGSSVRKIFLVSFSAADGSLFVSLPYFAHGEGLLSIATIPGGQTQSAIDLKVQGKCSSHRVKYAHHVSGEAHFSQTGKILTQIKRQSVPLKSANGHIFTLLVQGLHSFASADNPKDNAAPTPRRANLTINLGNVLPEAKKFVGRVFNAASIGPLLQGDYPDRIGPILPFRIGQGPLQQGFLLGNPHDLSDQTVLFVTFDAIRRLDPNRDVAMTFIGGFDPPEHVTDSTRATSMLVLNSPAENFNELSVQLGTVDLIPGKNGN